MKEKEFICGFIVIEKEKAAGCLEYRRWWERTRNMEGVLIGVKL